MSRSRTTLLLLFAVFIGLVGSSAAQSKYVELRVYVSYGTNAGPGNVTGQAGVSSGDRGGAFGDHPSDLTTIFQIHIQIYGDSGGAIGEKSPSTEGYATFQVVGEIVQGQNRIYPGYRVRVYGPEIDEEWAENVQPGLGDRMLNINIYKKGVRGKQHSKDKKGTVSVSGLAIPGKAQKEYDKGNEALSDDKLDKAKQHYQKAIEIYPQYDQAYINLGVVLIKTGDKAGGKQAFEKAVSINDKSARAYINLGKLAIQDHRFDDAFTLFNKSLSVEPLGAEALNGICQAGVIVEKFDQVIGAAKKLHSSPHDNLPMCHFAAGIAYRTLKKPEEALAEYNLYLKEASMSDALVVKAREAIEEINKSAVQR